MNLKLVPVERDFYRFLSTRLPRVEERVVERSSRWMRWQESHFFLQGQELHSGLIVYEQAGRYTEPLLYVEDEARLASLREEFEAKRRAEEEEGKAREAELRAKHEARLRELVGLFKSYCKENESYFPFDLSSQIDYIIAYLLVEERKVNKRLDDILFEIEDKLFAIPYPQRAQVIQELKRNAVYVPTPEQFKIRYVFPTIEVIYSNNSNNVIGKERGLGKALSGANKFHYGGKIALFKCPPPKEFTPYVLAVRYVEKPRVLLIYEYVKFDLQELLAKREYLKALEKKILERA